MWLRAPVRRCLRLTTLLFGRELMLSFLHKTKATGFYLGGESGFCEMQKASAPGQERMRLAGRKGTRLLSAPLVGGAGTALPPTSSLWLLLPVTAPVPRPACHCSTLVPHVPRQRREGRTPMGKRAEKGAREHPHMKVEAEAGAHLSCRGIQTLDPATLPASRDTSHTDVAHTEM